MTTEQMVQKSQLILAHAWMVRTFLKHAEEIQEDEGMLDIPRTLYDSIRAVEPAFERKDYAEYLRRLKGKISKFRKAAEYYNAHFREFSPHTNYEMAGQSLNGIVLHLEELFAVVDLEAVFKEQTSRDQISREQA